MLGVIQEQHADRCRLFQQWKGLDFPFVQDALNSNGIQVVSVYVAIDEHGVVQGRPRDSKTFVADFIEQDFEAPTEKLPVIDTKLATVAHWRAQLRESDSTANQIRLADSLIVWDGNAAVVREATRLYERAGQGESKRSDIRFRLGVARRLLYELDGRSDASEFASALSDWESALQLNPNH